MSALKSSAHDWRYESAFRMDLNVQSAFPRMKMVESQQSVGEWTEVLQIGKWRYLCHRWLWMQWTGSCTARAIKSITGSRYEVIEDVWGIGDCGIALHIEMIGIAIPNNAKTAQK